jgi:hypothetical protein
MVEIKHLSISVKEPEKAAKALADMTGGKAEAFISRNMPGAWVCIWDEKTNHLIEFLPDGYLMYSTEYGADFKKLDFNMSYNSTHFQLEVKTPLKDIKAMADKYNLQHKFRPNRGGPLYDVWFEKEFLVEFVSDEIRALVAPMATASV